MLSSAFTEINSVLDAIPTEIDWKQSLKIASKEDSQLQEFIGPKSGSLLSSLFPTLPADRFITRSAFRASLLQWAELLKLSVDRSILFDFVNLVFEVFQTEQRWISVWLQVIFDVDRARDRQFPLSLPASAVLRRREVYPIVHADVPSDERLAERGGVAEKFEWKFESSDGVRCVPCVCEDLHRGEELLSEERGGSREHCSKAI